MAGLPCCSEEPLRLAAKLNRLFVQPEPVDVIAKAKPRPTTPSSTKKAFAKKLNASEDSARASLSERGQDMDLGLPSIDRDYDHDPQVDLSTGFGVGIKRYVHRKTKMPRAVLVLPKTCIPASVDAEKLHKQLEVLCKVDHPNIVPFRECCEDSKHLCLVYDWCGGGLFLSQLSKYEGMLTERNVGQVIRELLSALAAAHSFGVHHLDLGLCSLFVQYPDRLSPIKVFGIGLVGLLMPPVTSRKTSRSNKHYYASPELLMHDDVSTMASAVQHACDIWSVGAILYTMCSGRPPFGAGSRREVSQRVLKSQLVFGIEFDEYSQYLKDVVEQLMMLPTGHRPTAATILKHPWLTNTRTLQLKEGKVTELTVSKLNTFARQDRVKQAVSRLLADIGLSMKAYKGLEKVFDELDLNGDGTISLGELAEITTKMPDITEKQVRNIIRRLDRNGNSNVDISEFVAALLMEQDELDERLIKKAFAKLDKNGDARVNKRELFTVLRQYSGSLQTKQVSRFVGRTDGDGDQKIDYREFCGLFPHMKERDEELEHRMAMAKAAIECGPRYLERFKETTEVWIKKVRQHRDKMEWACGVRPVPHEMITRSNYSYEKSHLTEFEVQAMMKDIVTTLKHPPGRRMTKAQKKAQKDRRRSGDETGKEPRQMMGMTILSTSASIKGLGEHSFITRRTDDSDGGESGSDGDSPHHKFQRQGGPETVSAMQIWSSVVARDRNEKAKDAEWKEEAYLMDHLYWLMKIKSDYQWQLPIVHTIEECREACIEEIVEITAESKQDLMALQGCMDEKYVLREHFRFRDLHLPANAHLLPMGSFAGKNLKSTVWWEQMESMKCPSTFFFGWVKNDITQQKVTLMKEVHMTRLEWIGKYLTALLKSIDDFMDECAEDLAISSTLESLMPCPPTPSHLFLKHCEGREVAADACTPRSDDVARSDEEDVIAQGEDALISAATDSHKSNGGKRKRLERNAVLTQNRVPVAAKPGRR